MLDPLELLADHEQTGFRQQVVDVRHPPGEAVLARQHGKLGAALAHRVDRRPRTTRTARWSCPGRRRGRRGRNRRRARPGRRWSRSCGAWPGASRRARVPGPPACRRRTARAPCARRRSAYPPPAPAVAPASRAAPAEMAAARRSGPARRAGRRRCPTWCQRGPSPHGIGWREKYSAGATACPSANAQAAFTNETVVASSSDAIGSTRVPMSKAGSPSGAITGRNCASVIVGTSPCRLTTTSCRPSGSSSASAANTRSEPDGKSRIGQHRAAARGAHRVGDHRIAAGDRHRPQVRPRVRGPARARSSACRGCRRAACRAAASTPCGRE